MVAEGAGDGIAGAHPADMTASAIVESNARMPTITIRFSRHVG